MATAPFSRRATQLVVGLSVASFAVGVLASIFSGEIAEIPSAGADSFSPSAIGHKAFVETLKKLGTPVTVSRHASARKAGASAALLLLEPRVSFFEGVRDKDIKDAVRDAKKVLLVLPKWRGEVNPLKPRHLADAQPIMDGLVERVLDAAGVPGTLVRPGPGSGGWVNGLGVDPTLPSPQLVRAAGLSPIVARAEGILLGEATIAGTRLFVLADPDVLETHGLGQGENALFAVRIVERLARPGGPVVVDEVLHGFEEEPTVFKELFRFPLVLAVLSVLFALLLGLWAGMGRFGAPLPPPRTLEPGKRFLIDNTAELLRLGGHSSRTLQRYWQTSFQAVCQDLHAHPALSPRQRREWLAKLGERRGTEDLSKLEREVEALSKAQADPARVVALASRIYRWRTEIVHGTDHDRTHPSDEARGGPHRGPDPVGPVAQRGP
jgi:hypothetical protein